MSNSATHSSQPIKEQGQTAQHEPKVNKLTNYDYKPENSFTLRKGVLIHEALYSKPGLPKSNTERLPATLLEFEDRKAKTGRDEMKLMAKIKHKNIIEYFESFDYDGHFYIGLQPSFGGGNLRHFIQTRRKERIAFTEADAWNVFSQVADALQFLDMNKIAHRSVSPEYIAFPRADSLDIKLIEFSRAAVIEDGEMRTIPRGELFIMSPEMMKVALAKERGEDTKGLGYGRKTDIWSFGYTVYFILTGHHPFRQRLTRNAENWEKTLQEIHNDKARGEMFEDKHWTHLTPEDKEITKALLAIDAKERPSGRELPLKIPAVRNRTDHNLCLAHKGERESIVKIMWNDHRIRLEDNKLKKASDAGTTKKRTGSQGDKKDRKEVKTGNSAAPSDNNEEKHRTEDREGKQAVRGRAFGLK